MDKKEKKKLNFENGIYFTDSRNLNNERKYHNTYKKLKKKEIDNGVNKDIAYVFYEGKNPNTSAPLVIIQNWLKK